jgi:6-phosphogluconate dehydrogenase
MKELGKNMGGEHGQKMSKAAIGIIGLGVMGRNLAFQLAAKGHGVAVTDPWPAAVRDFRAATLPLGEGIAVHDTLEDLTAALARPRAVLIMVKAGAPVQQQIDALVPLLEPDDLIVDGGNSHYGDTARRGAALADCGLRYLGSGISGGEEGARTGASIMVGGSREGFARVAGLLNDIAAKVDGVPCAAYLGDGGAGHFVKAVHNGIEYAEMQLIAEAYLILKDLLALSHESMAAVFDRWNQGALRSYLIEITAKILTTKDTESEAPLVEMILDRAGQKGTGQWAAEAALDLGVPAPSLAEAVTARSLSALKDQRIAAEAVLPGPERPAPVVKDGLSPEQLGEALLAARICVFAQGFALMKAAKEAYGWSLDLAQVARIWRAGCIIRADLLQTIDQAYREAPDLDNLLLAPGVRDTLASTQGAWRQAVGAAVGHGLPVPALGSTLAYFDTYRRARLPANLIQAQRDYFGAHGFERTDRPGSFHGPWQEVPEDTQP